LPDTPVLNDLRQLRYFVAVADAGQLTQAARRLDVAQPTLSQAIARLESQLGVQLLDRANRGVTPTPAGSVFLERALHVVASADEAERAARAFQRGHVGELVVGYVGVPMGRWAEIFDRLSRTQPGVRVSWQALDFPRIGRDLLEGTDIALVAEPTEHPDLGILVLHQERLAAVMPAGHPLAEREELRVADLLDETFIAGDATTDPVWQEFWHLDKERGGPAKLSERRAHGSAEGLETVAAGKAIGTVQESLARALPHPGVVSRPIVDARPARLALVWDKEHENPLVDVVVDIAREVCD
jgi:DNA-binding transcriptional LysR family regulator